MTVLLGPTPCRECGATVTVVRRAVMLWGHAEDCDRRHAPCAASASTELREVATVDAAGDHRCRGAEAAR